MKLRTRFQRVPLDSLKHQFPVTGLIAMIQKYSTRIAIGLTLFFLVESDLPLQAQTEKPVPKITPGKVIVPFQKMRRIWGELVSVDLKTRTGTFRAEGEDKLYRFSAMPYAEMLHHATSGDLSDFRIGERAIFRMHVNEAGEWYWLTYIQDEMNMLNGHKEYYVVESIEAAKGRIGFTWAKADKSYIREEGLFLETDAETQFWKGGKPAKFSDIKLGDTLRAKTHGIGKGRVRVCWHVFLDDKSLLAFREKQMAVHAGRLAKDGLPSYVDRINDGTVELTLFRGGSSVAETLLTGKNPKALGDQVRLAPAGVNLKPTAEAIAGTVVSCVRAPGATFKLVLKTDGDTGKLRVTEVARLWVAKSP